MKRLAIVDLDNTLVAAQDDCVYTVDDIEFDNLIIRPFAPEFINWLYKYFDIILFTTGFEKYKHLYGNIFYSVSNKHFTRTSQWSCEFVSKEIWSSET